MFLRKWIYPLLCFFIVYPYMATVRAIILDRNLQRTRLNRKESFLYSHWHGDIPLLVCKFGFSHLCTMASFSRDGEVIANFLRMLRYRVIRGTSRRGVRKALQDMRQAFSEGWDLILAVDGPKGPRHEVKLGVVYLASKGKMKIIPAVANAKYKFVFHKSWDKAWVPFPFSPAVIIVGNPIAVDGGETEEGLQLKRQELQQTFDILNEKASKYFNT